MSSAGAFDRRVSSECLDLHCLTVFLPHAPHETRQAGPRALNRLFLFVPFTHEFQVERGGKFQVGRAGSLAFKHHCWEGRGPPLLLSAHTHLPGGGAPIQGSRPRDKPFPVELLISSSRVILVPLRVSVLVFGSGSGSGSVQGPGSLGSCWSLWRSCCQLWNRCWCPGPGTGSWVGCKGARPLHPGGDPAGPPRAQPAPFSSLHCAPVPVPRRTCCLLSSALWPSLPLPPWFPACSPSFHHLSGPWHPHPQDCAPVGREQPWVSGFGHGALEVEESSPQAPAGFSLGHCWLY